MEEKEDKIRCLNDALEENMRECEQRIGEATQRAADARREMLEARLDLPSLAVDTTNNDLDWNHKAADAAEFKLEQLARERERDAAEARRLEEAEKHLQENMEASRTNPINRALPSS